MSYRDTLYFVRWFVCLRLSLFMFNLCDLLSITILIFFTIIHIISLKQTNLVFGSFDLKSSLRVLLSFCLLFCQIEPGFAYKSAAYKKSVYLFTKEWLFPFFWKNSFCKLFKLFYERAEAWSRLADQRNEIRALNWQLM